MRAVADPMRHARSERRRAALAVALFAAVLALGLTGIAVLTRSTLNPALLPPTAREGAADHRLGALVVVPPGGRNCELQGFDNASGRLIELGTTDCDSVLRSSGREAIPALDGKARMQAIQKTFQR